MTIQLSWLEFELPLITAITLTAAGSSTAQDSAAAIISTGVYTSVDGTKTGWTGSPDNSNLYTNIDEVTATDADYIQSPNVLSSPGPIEFDLNNSLAAGSWELDFRARFTLAAAQVKITLLNAGSTSVGDSGWINVTSATFADFTPTITTSGTATRVRIEVQ